MNGWAIITPFVQPKLALAVLVAKKSLPRRVEGPRIVDVENVSTCKGHGDDVAGLAKTLARRPPRAAVCPKPQRTARPIRVKIIPAAIRSSVRCELGQLAPRSAPVPGRDNRIRQTGGTPMKACGD
jgi:hypothetical protein